MPITVVLVEPESSGNVGSVARAMKNFGLKKLVLVNPQCGWQNDEAKSRAMHAQDILLSASVRKHFQRIVTSFDQVIGTTAQVGSDYNIPRSPLLPSQLAEKLRGSRKSRIAIVFGREGRGLSNGEIRQCDITVTIPASAKYPVLNISHAAAILFYEMFGASSRNVHTPLSGGEKRVVLQRVDAILDRLSFPTPQKKETQRRLWKRMLGKAMLTKREGFALLGFLKRVQDELRK